MRRIWIFTFMLVLSDIFSFFVSFILVYYFRFLSGFFINQFTPLNTFFSIISYSTIIIIILSALYGLYKEKRSAFDSKEFENIFKALIITFLLVIASTYLFKTSIFYSRITVVLTFIAALFVISMFRFILRELLALFRKKGMNQKNVVIIGAGKLGKLISKKISSKPELGYKFIGFLDHNKDSLGKIDDLKRIAREMNIDVVFIALPMSAEDKINQIILDNDNITFKYIPNIIETISEPVVFDEIGDLPIITITKKDVTDSYKIIKRGADLMLSVIFLLLLSPLILLISSIIIAVYGESPIYRQKRIGQNQKEFMLYKFKTMKKGKRPRNDVKFLFKTENDPRVTKFGKFLRRTFLDEVPQLINVLRGEMSLVGPRPHLKEEMHFFKGWRKKRFEAKPGMTGLWQISGRHELSMDKSIALDIYYVKHMSFKLDFKILLKTIPAIIFSKEKY